MHRLILSAVLSIFFLATGYAQDQRQAVTLLGISCNNDFYVTAVGVAGAVVGTVFSRGRKELTRVIVTAGSDKLAEKAAPRVCETLAGTFSPTPPPNIKQELPPPKQVPSPCPAGKFYSLNQQTCVELNVAEPCALGETYNSLLGKCTSGGSQTARLVCGNGEILVDGKCTKPLITPTCSSSETAFFRTSVFRAT
jgi:hypothetical protein